jgi:hypothetical protein
MTFFQSKYRAVFRKFCIHSRWGDLAQWTSGPVSKADEQHEERFMRRHLRFTLTAALLIVVLEVLTVARADSTSQARLVAPCDMRLRVELTPDVPDPHDAGFISSLLGNHPDYRLILQREDPDDSSVIALDLSGPGPEAGCREVVTSMRKDARVASVELQPGSASSTQIGGTPLRRRGLQLASAVQPTGTMHAGPDGDWILEPLNGVSYAQEASDRYECDIWAVHQTGFDPTEDDGGVSPEALPGKRADYLRAEAACFQARGYIMR